MSDHHISTEQGEQAGFAALRRAWALIDAVPVAIFEWVDDGHTLVWNRAAERLFGWPAAEVVGTPCPALVHLDVASRDQEILRVRGDALAGRAIDGEAVAVTRPDGSTVDVSLSTVPLVCDDVSTVVGTAVDLGNGARLTRRLMHLATHDPLTDLGNRRAFEQTLERIVARVRQGGRRGALLMIDIDLLKQVNDTFGHLAGDALLISIGDALRTATRPRDVVARVGGDEFAVALEEVDGPQIASIAERIRSSIAALDAGPDDAAHVTASVGGIVIDGALGVVDLLAAADDALYVAKRTRDSVELYLEQRSQPDSAGGESLILSRLRHALRDNFGAQYQGVRDTDDGTLYCEEALARITVNGTYSRAAEFIATAERGGLIREIDRRMFGLVLDRLEESSSARLSLNVSSASLADPDTLALLRKRAPSTGYGRRLILEARESDLFADAARAERWAQSVRELGALVAIDDFTAARSSLARIATLPVDLVKVGPDTITSLADPAHRARLGDLASTARDRAITVIAKGIQDAATLELLPQIGVSLAQGFLIEPPRAVIGLIDVLETAGDFGAVSPELLAWEFMVPESAVESLWGHALDSRLLHPDGADAGTGETMFVLTTKGRAVLQQLRAERERTVGPSPRERT